jgi:hypothetical protein
VIHGIYSPAHMLPKGCDSVFLTFYFQHKAVP